MGLVGNFFNRLASLGGSPQAQAASTTSTTTGTVATIARLLGSASTFSLITGSNSNLSLVGLNIQAAAALGAGTSQQAIVREYDSATLRAVEYPVTISTPAAVPAAPTLVASSGNGQVTLAWSDGSANGSAITAHNLYRSTTAGAEVLVAQNITSASPYTDTGLTNGQPYFYRLSAVNGVGEGTLSAEVSATPSAWILGSGAWNDTAPWDDTQNWKDAA